MKPLLVGFALVVAVTTSGCGGADETARPAQAATGTAASLPEIPRLVEEEGAAADATFGDCELGAGAQAVAGAVTNPTEQTRDYVVTVSWIGAGDQVLARGSAVAGRVPPGETRDVRVTATVPVGVVACTFEVLRGTLG